MSDAIIANAGDVATLLTFTESDLRILASKMKLDIDRQRTFFNAVRKGGRPGICTHRIPKVSAATSLRIEGAGEGVLKLWFRESSALVSRQVKVTLSL